MQLHRQLPGLLLALTVLAIVPGCEATGVVPQGEEESSSIPWRDEWTPPEDWAEMPPAYFEQMVLTELPDGTRTALSKSVLYELSQALDKQDQSSVRAAVILARANTRQAGDRLISRLAKRQPSEARAGDAGDVIAAAAIGRLPAPQRWDRIVRFAIGKNPHPDLEVRVECACSALSMGSDAVIPFLLQVLRIGTWEGRDDVLDFEPGPRTAWVRGRAAEALSARAGVPLQYQPDAPIASREREARRLAALLADAIAEASK